VTPASFGQPSPLLDQHRILVISGTGTGVGKTIVTAAVAALAHRADRRVAVVKLAQTGVHDGPGADSDIPDISTVRRLSGVTDTHELARFPDPLSPEAAARRSGLPPVNVSRAVTFTAELAADRDLVLVEGAGGLLVRYDPEGSTIADFAAALDAPVVVVTAAGLGTLNHTTLTLEALAARKLTLAGVVVGSWPDVPGVAEQENLADLEMAIGGPLAGSLPEGAGALDPAAFHAAARRGLGAWLGGLPARLAASGDKDGRCRHLRDSGCGCHGIRIELAAGATGTECSNPGCRKDDRTTPECPKANYSGPVRHRATTNLPPSAPGPEFPDPVWPWGQHDLARGAARPDP
jgi:dethiobiotin synthetase